MYFKNDVFISYAFLDNLALKQGEQGWVEDFHNTIGVRLAHLMKENPEICCYPKSEDCDIFTYNIDDKLSKTAILILVLSPKYIQSKCCIKELKEFIKSAVPGTGEDIYYKSRIFKILKTAVPHNALPPEITDITEYEFYIVDPSTGRVKEVSPESRGELDQFYFARVDDVAHDICDTLERMKHMDVKGKAGREERLKIYLAETSYDLKAQRDIIKRELIENGHEILPDCQLPLIEAEFEKTVGNFLDQCKLSIHLVGGDYGLIPEGSRKSIVELQNELAVEKSRDGKLQRLIWLPPGNGFEIDDERQERFIYQVRTNAEAQYGADMFETPLINFKYAIRDKINAIKSAPIKIGDKKPGKENEKEAHPAATIEPTGKELPQIYLICDRRDLDNITELEDYLYKSEFDVILPAFSGDEEDLIRDHRENLKFCDAAVIYYGAGNDLWMRSISRDFRKIAGYGRTFPFLGKAVFLAPPAVQEKERFRAHDWFVIDGMKGFAPEAIEPFTEILKAAGKS